VSAWSERSTYVSRIAGIASSAHDNHGCRPYGLAFRIASSKPNRVHYSTTPAGPL